MRLDRQNKLILIIQDKRYYRLVLLNLLKYVGYKVHTAKNGLIALKLLSKYDYCYDLVITDLHMPFVDGFNIISEIRKHKNKDLLPIIALTSSFKEEEDISQLEQLNVNKFIYTCTPYEDFLYIIDQILFSKEEDLRRLSRELSNCPVLYQMDNIWHKAETSNLTCEGTFIRTKNIPSVGSIINLKLKLPTFSEDIEIKARIIHTHKNFIEPNLMNTSGMGIIFTEISDYDKNKIKRFLNSFTE